MEESNNSSSSESSSNEAKRQRKLPVCTLPRPKPAKKCSSNKCLSSQKFREAWKSEPLFKGWLEKSIRSSTIKDKAFCAICNADITCGHSEILRHANSERHKNLSRQCSSTQSLTSYVISQNHDDIEARKVELRICAFLSEHFLPISLCEPLCDLLNSLFKESKVMKKVRLGKQRTTNLIRQVLGFSFLDSLCNDLRKSYFSVIIDETTDRSTKKQLAIMVQYSKNNSMKVSLLDLVEISDGRAASIFDVLTKCFTEKNIPMENIVGFCADTTNSMMGQYNSVSSLSVKAYPSIQIIKCSCHLIHLCASYACLKLPKTIEDLCRNIYSHFNLSAKRIASLEQLQKFVNLEPHKILAPGQTRWLSLHACIVRILEPWDALKLYYTDLCFSDPTYGNELVFKSLNNKFFYAYFQFLDHNLSRFNNFNLLFQSETPKLHFLKDEVTMLLKNICSDFMDTSYVKQTSIVDLNPLDVTKYVNVKTIYLGLTCHETIASLKNDSNALEPDFNVFYNSCREFLIEAANQIRKRFIMSEETCSILEYLKPENVAKGERYVYKFVCDPEALLTLGLGSNESRSGRQEVESQRPQHQDPRRFSVFSHHYYSHHHRAAAATYADLLSPANAWSSSSSQPLLSSHMNWPSTPQYDISSYSQFKKLNYDYLQDPVASSFSPISSHFVAPQKEEQPTFIERGTYFDPGEKCFAPSPRNHFSSSIAAGAAPQLSTVSDEVSSSQDTLMQLQNCSRSQLPACAR